jgi:hypothetical protein
VKISAEVHLVGFSTILNNYRTMRCMYNIKILNVQQAKIITNFKLPEDGIIGRRNM